MTNPSPTPRRRDEILQTALREQAGAQRGRRVVSSAASVALIAVVAGIAAWRFVPEFGPSEEEKVRALMASQPRIPTPEESNRQDPRYRLTEQAAPRLIVERVATTPGIAKKLAATPGDSTISRATDDDLARALHSADPTAGLVRVDGRLFAASGGTLVRPEDLPVREADTEPRSMILSQPSVVGV